MSGRYGVTWLSYRDEIDNTQNPGRREPMPSPQLSASATEAVISPDRWLLDRVANPILAFEGDRRRIDP